MPGHLILAPPFGVTPDIINRAHQIEDFASASASGDLSLSSEAASTIYSITAVTLRPVSTRPPTTRTTLRAKSVEAPNYSPEWATDRGAFERAVRAFCGVTAQYRDNDFYHSFPQQNHNRNSVSAIEADDSNSPSIGATPPRLPRSPSAPRPRQRFFDSKAEEAPPPLLYLCKSPTPGSRTTATSAE